MQFIKRGKSAAFDELYVRYGQAMYSFFYKMLWQDVEKANDFTQEIFVKIIEHPEKFDTSKRFSSWLYAVAHNLCKNEYRKHQNRKKAYNGHLQLQEQNTYIPETHDKEVFKIELEQALNRLSPSHKACFLLRYQKEMSVKEISKVLECPEGTVKSRLFHATKKLAGLLKNVNTIL